MNCLSDEERTRTKRFATDLLRNRFIVSRGTTRKLLGAYLGRDPSVLEFREGNHGKPFLTGESQALGLQFNVSHSRDLALVAVSRIGEIGVDLEWVRSNLEQAEIASRFFSDNEAARIRELSGSPQVHHFFELWTCKEAFVKARGGGISFGLRRFEVLFPTDSGKASILNDDGARSSWIIHRFEPAPGCLGALAVEGERAVVSLLEWSPPASS
jgi:4'-phosphopantetheinyl transferase